MKKLFMLVFITSAILASCTKEKVNNMPSNGKQTLGVSANIKGTVGTRAYKDGTDFANGDKIAVFITGGAGATAYVPFVSPYTFDGTNWAAPASDASKIFLSNEIGTVYGFYPSTTPITMGTGDNATITTTLPAAEASFNGTNQTDYMYAVPTYNVAGGVSNATNAEKASLNFKHALSKLTFVVNRGESYTGTGSLTAVKLSKLASFNAGPGTMLVKDGTLAWTDAPSDVVSFTGTALINAFNATPFTTPVVTGLVAPRADNSATTLTLTIDGKDMSITLPLGLANIGASWAAGNNYTYTITVNGSALNITSVTITDWQANEVGTVNVN